ncbi:MAG: CDP-alcohol phosphatidyltransferase family protein [Calditrichaeota bacterium]|nr:CDP-alcohol phosphatidyltransferase family protein [Calditrichota bacterium]
MHSFWKKIHFIHESSLKSKQADELLNTYFIRPVASLFVGLLYPTPLLPIHVVLLGSLFGIASAILVGFGQLTWGGIFLFIKNILDAVDGQLARSRHQEDRRGRFLDSISDFLVNFLLFGAMGWHLSKTHGGAEIWILTALAFLSLSLRVSYFVYYFVAYLHLEQKLQQNRQFEILTESDRRGDPLALFLQKIYIILYSWQDRLVGRLDRWCIGKGPHAPNGNRQEFLNWWYSHLQSLRLSSFLGLGTELTLVILGLLLNEIDFYLWFNVIFLNAYAVFLIVLRKHLARKNAHHFLD